MNSDDSDEKYLGSRQQEVDVWRRIPRVWVSAKSNAFKIRRCCCLGVCPEIERWKAACRPGVVFGGAMCLLTCGATLILGIHGAVLLIIPTPYGVNKLIKRVALMCFLIDFFMCAHMMWRTEHHRPRVARLQPSSRFVFAQIGREIKCVWRCDLEGFFIF